MPGEQQTDSPYLSQFITWIFIFSTIYTLAFYYDQGAQIQNNYDELSDQDGDYMNTGIIGILDGVLDFISWLSPFALVKGLLIILMADMPDLYQFIDLLFLRPISWVIAVLTVNYIKSWIPTLSGE